MVTWDVPASAPDQLFHFLANPDRQIYGKCVAIVQVRQDRKWRVRLGLELFGELLPVRHDRHDLTAYRVKIFLRLCQCIGINAAVGTPMAAVKGDGNRSFA